MTFRVLVVFFSGLIAVIPTVLIPVAHFGDKNERWTKRLIAFVVIAQRAYEKGRCVLDRDWSLCHSRNVLSPKTGAYWPVPRLLGYGVKVAMTAYGFESYITRSPTERSSNFKEKFSGGSLMHAPLDRAE